jgi:hypothetical protein
MKKLMSCVAPSGVNAPTLVSTTSKQVNLKWTPPNDHGACEVTGYKILRDDGAEGPITTSIVFKEGPPALEIADPYVFEHVIDLGVSFTGLNVRFILVAINSEGSTASNSYLTVLVAEAPSAPSSGPVRKGSTSNSLSVELPIVSETGGLLIDAYQL